MDFSGSIKGRKFLYWQINYSLLKEDITPLTEREHQEHISAAYLPQCPIMEKSSHLI
jgi:hypothetical protein